MPDLFPTSIRALTIVAAACSFATIACDNDSSTLPGDDAYPMQTGDAAVADTTPSVADTTPNLDAPSPDVATGDTTASGDTAPIDGPASGQCVPDAGTTRGCAAFLGTTAQIVPYGPTINEYAIQLPESFPRIKHMRSNVDFFTGNAFWCSSFDIDINPPSRTLPIPHPQTTYRVSELFLRGLILTDECNNTHVLNGAAGGGCVEPRFLFDGAQASGNVTITCSSVEHDLDCMWECG